MMKLGRKPIPNLPKSPWWYTDDPARAVGFRIVRSYKPLDQATIAKFHDIDNEEIQLSVDIRLEEGPRRTRLQRPIVG